jgi:predicted lactoylglutathione lyase
MEQRVTVITLGVEDLTRARTFYEALGWRSNTAAELGVVFFQAGDMVVSLWDNASLAEDSGVPSGTGFGGVTLALNVASAGAVDEIMADAAAAGGRVTRAAGETFWGGYSGVFTDPDGHPWEIAHNPHWTLTPDGGVRLPD